MARGLMSAFKGFDAFGKTMEDVKIKTRTGAFLTMISAAIILTFTLIEFIDYRRMYTDTSVIVDRSRGERLVIKMNITFPKVPCYLLSMDVMDISGEHQMELDHSMVKTRLDQSLTKINDDKFNTGPYDYPYRDSKLARETAADHSFSSFSHDSRQYSPKQLAMRDEYSRNAQTTSPVPGDARARPANWTPHHIKNSPQTSISYPSPNRPAGSYGQSFRHNSWIPLKLPQSIAKTMASTSSQSPIVTPPNRYKNPDAFPDHINLRARSYDAKPNPIASTTSTSSYIRDTPLPNPDLKNELDKIASQRGHEYCGSCYGGVAPESGCCNTCESVRQAYLHRGWSFANPEAVEQCRDEHWTERIHEQQHEGCNIAGRLKVNKVIGNIHLSPGRSFLTNSYTVHELVPYLKTESPHTFGHIIHEFSFESESQQERRELTEEMRRRLGIVYNTLDTSGNFHPNKDYMYQYFLKVVGTRYHFLDESFAYSHQYSVSTYERDLALGGAAGRNAQGLMTSHGITGLPGVFFNFEISPMLVVHHERRQSFAHFLTSMCAIVGGVLTVASMLDGILFRTGKIIKKGAAAVQEEKSRPSPMINRSSSYGNSIKMH
ncbi:hypothetical protein FRC03_004135 [Tulasnella sp. 419]|nr:hypothetical protein FRC03_004135 [Tulasnella sp. 419]